MLESGNKNLTSAVFMDRMFSREGGVFGSFVVADFRVLTSATGKQNIALLDDGLHSFRKIFNEKFNCAHCEKIIRTGSLKLALFRAPVSLKLNCCGGQLRASCLYWSSV